MTAQPALRRDLGLVALTLYGVGVIVGAGIYVLVGKVAGLVGNGVWLAFLGAAVTALPTGLSYSELASRYPRSAGEAVYAERAFGRAWLSFLVGFLVMASGVTSTATIAHGFANYFGDLVGLAASWHALVVVVFLLLLSLLNHGGIKMSAWVNAVCTIASITGLLVLVAMGVGHWGTVDLLDIGPPAGGDTGMFAALLAGVALSYYAFIGFEDICNVAEEVRDPQRTVPRAILLAVAITSVLYVAIGITVVSVVPAATLAASDVPLVEVSRRLMPGLSTAWLSVLALLAMVNSALFNLIMCSRIFYGMGGRQLIPRVFARVHERRGTPTWGIVAAFVLAVGFALTGVLQVLAEATNTVILGVFLLVNLSLVVVKLRGVPPDQPQVQHFRVPVWVPGIGVAMSLWFGAQFSAGAYVRGGAVLMVGVGLFALQQLLRRRLRA